MDEVEKAAATLRKDIRFLEERGEGWLGVSVAAAEAEAALAVLEEAAGKPQRMFCPECGAPIFPLAEGVRSGG